MEPSIWRVLADRRLLRPDALDPLAIGSADSEWATDWRAADPAI
jgi:hypothetical protein